jgi:hypothetical protein
MTDCIFILRCARAEHGCYSKQFPLDLQEGDGYYSTLLNNIGSLWSVECVSEA